MRRILVTSALAALPLLASAQIVTAPEGQLIGEVNNQIGAQQCRGEATLDVVWTMKPRPPSPTLGGVLGTVRIIASDLQRAGSDATDPRICFFDGESGPGTTPPNAIEVAQFDELMLLQNNVTISGPQLQAMATKLKLDCNAETSGKPIYMCALGYPNSGTANTSYVGYANGTFTLNTRKPGMPTNVAAESADRALRVSFTEATTGENATEFRAEAITADPRDSTPNQPHTARGNSSPLTIKGLTNNVEYTVTVIALSDSGTESDPSAATTGTPLPTDDFWDWYQRAGGVEEGGCATGAAGVLGLLGAAALLRVRRRKP